MIAGVAVWLMFIIVSSSVAIRGDFSVTFFIFHFIQYGYTIHLAISLWRYHLLSHSLKDTLTVFINQFHWNHFQRMNNSQYDKWIRRVKEICFVTIRRLLRTQSIQRQIRSRIHRWKLSFNETFMLWDRRWSCVNIWSDEIQTSLEYVCSL